MSNYQSDGQPLTAEQIKKKEIRERRANIPACRASLEKNGYQFTKAEGFPTGTFKVTADKATYLQVNDEYTGYCIVCGEEAEGVEPDARRYECEFCGEGGVYGAEELMLAGRIQIV